MHAPASLQEAVSLATPERRERAKLILQRRWLRDVRSDGRVATATCSGLVGLRLRVDLATFASRCECGEPALCEHVVALLMHLAPPVARPGGAPPVQAPTPAPAPPPAPAIPAAAPPQPAPAPLPAPEARAVPSASQFEARTLVVQLDPLDPGRLVLAGEQDRRIPERAIESLRWLWWRRDNRERLSGEARTLPQALLLLHSQGLRVEAPGAPGGLAGATALFHQRALGESVHVRLLDAGTDAGLALAQGLEARGAMPLPGPLPYDMWTLPPESGFASWFLDAWARGAEVLPDPTLNPKPLREVDVQLDVGCLPARLKAPAHPLIADFLRRVLHGEPEVDAANEQTLVPATRVVDVEEGLRAMGANVLYRRLAPPGQRYLQWPEQLPEDVHGARPRLRETFRGALSERPPGLREDVELEGYQREAVAFLLHHDLTCLLADDMGLGKTLEAIAAAQFLPGRVLVVVPASAREVWRREIGKFTVESSVVLGPGADPRSAQGPEKYVVVGYSNLEAMADALADTSFDLVVLDESHYVKNAATGRAKLVRDKLLPIPRRLVISGTPVMNTPDEVRAQLAFLHPEEWSDASWFKRRFSEPFAEGTPEVREAVLARLRQFLEGVMLRREKETALPDLPAKTILWHRVALPPEARRAYVELEAEFEAFVRAEGAASLSTAKAGGKLERLKQAALSGKLPQVVAFVRELLAKGDKVVLFSRYRDAIASLQKELADAGVVVLTGDSAPEERADAERRFQTDDACRVFIGQLVAAGTALTLTAGTHAVFVDLDWNPANHRQAMDRIHRRGQTKAVSAHFFLAEGTIDEDVAHALDVKGRMMDALLSSGGGELRGAKRIVGERILARRAQA